MGEEAVAAAGQSLDEARIVGGIAQGFAQLVDGGSQAVVEVNESVRRPVLLAQLLASHHFAGVLKKNGQYVNGLVVNLDTFDLLPQFSRGEVHIERPKAQNSRRL